MIPAPELNKHCWSTVTGFPEIGGSKVITWVRNNSSLTTTINSSQGHTKEKVNLERNGRHHYRGRCVREGWSYFYALCFPPHWDPENHLHKKDISTCPSTGIRNFYQCSSNIQPSSTNCTILEGSPGFSSVCRRLSKEQHWDTGSRNRVGSTVTGPSSSAFKVFLM